MIIVEETYSYQMKHYIQPVSKGNCFVVSFPEFCESICLWEKSRQQKSYEICPQK